jgi:hypothetical protein
MFRLQYSIESISAAIGGSSTNRCALYSILAVKYWAQYPVYAMPHLVSVKSNLITVLDILASIFNWTYLRCYWWRVDKSKRVIRHIFWQIQGTSAGLRYVNSRAQSNSMLQLVCIWRLLYSIERISVGILDMSTIQCSLCSTLSTKCSRNPADYAMSIQVPVKTNIITFLAIQASIFNWTYLRCDWWYIDNRSALYSTFTAKYRAQQLVCAMSTLVPVKSNISTFLAIAGINIQFNVSSSISVTCRQFDERYTPHLQPKAAYVNSITLCQLRS